MKKHTLLALLLGAFLVGCMTPGRMARRCEKLSLMCGAERVVTVVKDTTIYISKDIEVKLPGDTVKIIERLNVTGGTVKLAPVTYNSGLITATAWVGTGNKLNVFAYLNQKSLTVNQRDTIYIDKYRTTESKTVTVTQKVIPKMYKTAALVVSIELLLLAIYLFIRFKPGILSIVSSIITKS